MDEVWQLWIMLYVSFVATRDKGRRKEGKEGDREAGAFLASCVLCRGEGGKAAWRRGGRSSQQGVMWRRLGGKYVVDGGGVGEAACSVLVTVIVVCDA